VPYPKHIEQHLVKNGYLITITESTGNIQNSNGYCMTKKLHQIKVFTEPKGKWVVETVGLEIGSGVGICYRIW